MREHILAHSVQLLWWTSNSLAQETGKTSTKDWLVVKRRTGRHLQDSFGHLCHEFLLLGNPFLLTWPKAKGDLYWRISQQKCRDKSKLQGQKPQMVHNVHIMSNDPTWDRVWLWVEITPFGTLVVKVRVTRRLIESFRKGTCACDSERRSGDLWLHGGLLDPMNCPNWETILKESLGTMHHVCHVPFWCKMDVSRCMI